MSYDILQSSTQSVLLFFMTDSTDHISAKTGLTCTVTISKNGAAFGSPSGAVSEIANGWYKVAGNATDTNTLGPLALHATATGADACDIIVANIVSYNPQSATNLGLSALPTANPGAANGVLIAGTNTATTFAGVAASGATPATAGITVIGGAASTTGGGTSAAAIALTGGAGAASTNGASPGLNAIGGGTTTVSGGDGATFTATGNKNGMTLAKAGSGQDFNATSTPLTLAKTTNITGFNDIAATAVVSGGAITTSSGAVSSVTTVATTTNLTNLPSIPNNWLTAAGIAAAALNGKGDWNIGKTGYSLSAGGISAIWQDTTAGDFTAANSIGLSIMNGVALGTGLTVNDLTTKTGYRLSATGVGDLLTTALTESYAADGAAGTLSQLLFGIQAFLQERSVSGTTLTVKKLDGATTAMTFTLNDGTSPTSLTRAT